MKNQQSFKSICTIILAMISLHAIAANRYWVGNNSNKNWNTTGNWSATSGGASGASVPGSADDVYFDGGGTGQLILDVSINVRMFTMSSGYTSNISQNDKSITIGTGGMILNDGSFTGNTGNIIVNGIFTLGGGSFTSTSGVLQIKGNYNKTGGSFSHNNGMVKFTGVISITGSTNFYDLSFYCQDINSSYAVDVASTFNVIHKFYTEGGSTRTN